MSDQVTNKSATADQSQLGLVEMGFRLRLRHRPYVTYPTCWRSRHIRFRDGCDSAKLLWDGQFRTCAIVWECSYRH